MITRGKMSRAMRYKINSVLDIVGKVEIRRLEIAKERVILKTSEVGG